MRRSRMRGFTLVELMITVAIIGVLAAVAMAGMRKYLASARSAEVANQSGWVSMITCIISTAAAISSTPGIDESVV